MSANRSCPFPSHKKDVGIRDLKVMLLNVVQIFNSTTGVNTNNVAERY